MQEIILGVDPGALSGAYACLTRDGRLLTCDDLPTIADKKTRWVDGPELLYRLLRTKNERGMHAIVERQGARPGQGLSSTFVSATAYGSLLAVLQIAGCSIEFVTAAVWKNASGLTQDKQLSLDRARLLYPHAELERKRDNGRAEALLLAHWWINNKSGREIVA